MEQERIVAFDIPSELNKHEATAAAAAAAGAVVQQQGEASAPGGSEAISGGIKVEEKSGYLSWAVGLVGSSGCVSLSGAAAAAAADSPAAPSGAPPPAAAAVPVQQHPTSRGARISATSAAVVPPATDNGADEGWGADDDVLVRSNSSLSVCVSVSLSLSPVPPPHPSCGSLLSDLPFLGSQLQQYWQLPGTVALPLMNSLFHRVVSRFVLCVIQEGLEDEVEDEAERQAREQMQRPKKKPAAKPRRPAAAKPETEET